METITDTAVETLITQHGEVIYELIGRSAGKLSTRHSVARVVISPGKGSRLHQHPEAEESYTFLLGRGRMLLGEQVLDVHPGDAVLVRSGVAHQIRNAGEQDLEFVAVCVPAWEPENSVYLDTEA